MASPEEILKKKIRATYAQAAVEVKKKIDDFWTAHRIIAARMLQDVADGKITKADYQKWLRGQVFTGKRWEEKLKDITNVYVNADIKARKIINGTTRNEFIEYANHTAYNLAKDLGISFELYDHKTVERLLKDNPKMLPEWKIDQPKDYIWNEKRVQNAVTQGIVQGESVYDIGKRLTTELATDNAAKMNMFARTAVTGAQNAGRIERLRETEEMGIEVKKKWLAVHDNRVRDTHAELDGQEVGIDEPFKVDVDGVTMEIDYPGDPTAPPELTYNCFVGDTEIATDSDIIRSYKHDYSGQLIEVETASGVKFTCTPNHPILTPGGWVRAAFLNDGDNLLIASVRNGGGFRRNGNIEHVHSCMKALYNAFHCMGIMSRNSTTRVDFHGDIPTTDVEVITKEWKLRGNGDPGSRDGINKLLFKNTNKAFLSKGAFMQHFRRVWLATLRLVGSFDKPLSFFGRGLVHPIIHGFRAIARSDTPAFQAQTDSAAGNMQFICESFNGFSGNVFVDNIVNIKVSTVSHIPVYNLQTGNGHYFANTSISQNGRKRNGNFAIVHNCRCTLIYVYPKYAPKHESHHFKSYREWEAEQKNG